MREMFFCPLLPVMIVLLCKRSIGEAMIALSSTAASDAESIRLPRLFKFLLGAAIVGSPVLSIADAQTYAINARIISSGSSTHSQSSCFGLDAVIAESVAGFSSGGQFDLSAGFSDVVAPSSSDHIFANGFEDCTL